MKKLIKLSLAAAVATAGLTTTASAVSLEEAIKGVDVSGQFRYRFQDRSGDNTNGAAARALESANGTDVEIELTAKVPVNDNVTAVFKIDNANDDGNEANTKASVDIEDYYFSYKNDALTVNAGQQNIPGRLTDGAQGDGLVALYNTGAGVTVGAALFNNHTAGAADGQDVASIIAMGTVGPVSFLGQYADVKDTLESYNLKADTKVGPVALGAEYTETTLDAALANTLGVIKDDRSTLTAYVSGKFDIVSAKLTYAKTGDNGSGSLHANAALAKDVLNGTTDAFGASLETPSEFLLWQLGSATVAEQEIIAVDASVALTDSISLRVAYADGEEGAAGTDIKETLGQISYKMSKNLNTYFRYSNYENGTGESDRGRVEVRYTF